MQRKIPTLRPADRFIIATRLFTVTASPYAATETVGPDMQAFLARLSLWLRMASFSRTFTRTFARKRKAPHLYAALLIGVLEE